MRRSDGPHSGVGARPGGSRRSLSRTVLLPRRLRTARLHGEDKRLLKGACCERGAQGLVSGGFRPRSRGQHLSLHLSAAWLQGQLLRKEGHWGAGPPTPPPPGPLVTEPGCWTVLGRPPSALLPPSRPQALGTTGLGLLWGFILSLLCKMQQLSPGHCFSCRPLSSRPRPVGNTAESPSGIVSLQNEMQLCSVLRASVITRREIIWEGEHAGARGGKDGRGVGRAKWSHTGRIVSACPVPWSSCKGM